ncbi:hypothetical protein J6590_096592 [Homalodisca vitripennis]|nr:hypothetical protein J6590_096592 [Homalodisca vitripennis]
MLTLLSSFRQCSFVLISIEVLDGSQVADGGRPIRYGGQLRIRGNPNKQSRTEAATLRGSGEGNSWRGHTLQKPQIPMTMLCHGEKVPPVNKHCPYCLVR